MSPKKNTPLSFSEEDTSPAKKWASISPTSKCINLNLTTMIRKIVILVCVAICFVLAILSLLLYEEGRTSLGLPFIYIVSGIIALLTLPQDKLVEPKTKSDGKYGK